MIATNVRSGRRWPQTRFIVLGLVLLGGAALVALTSLQATRGRVPDLAQLSREELESEKLRQEIRALESERSLIRLLPSYAAIGTAAGAILGFFATLRGQRRERESERVRRFDEYFSSAVENLGSDSRSAKASAAVSLMTFLRPDYEMFHDQVLLVAIANLKITKDPPISRLLVRTFEQALRATQRRDRIPDQGELDLSDAHLDRVDLSGLALRGSDIGFASLRHAVLRGSDLREARGFRVQLEQAILSEANLREARLNQAVAPKAQFHDARMSPSWLKDADLREAQFQGAQMQSAHLDGAYLEGARFEGANLNDTYFCRARLDDSAIRSIAAARNWQKAHFDTSVREELKRLRGEEPASCP